MLYIELEADTKKAVKCVKEELVKRPLSLCREPLEAGKLFIARSKLEKERVAEFAMHLKKLFKQAYPEERFVLGLKTPISTQLLLRGKPDTFEKLYWSLGSNVVSAFVEKLLLKLPVDPRNSI